MYHRVADLDVDPWGLAVTEENFESQLQHLAAEWNPTPLRSIALERPLLTRGRPKVAVTFDDGYVDNLERAVPILERYEIPATIFLTTDAIDRPGELWWDRLEHIFLATTDLPPRLPDEAIALLGDDPVVGSADLAAVQAGPSWRAWEPYRHPRHGLYRRLWQALFDFPGEERTRIVDTLSVWAGLRPEGRGSHRTLDRAQLVELAAHPLVDCQAHSTDHTPLPILTAADQLTAMRDSRNRLEAVIGGDIDGFAYPHGAISPTTLELAAEAGYTYCCTTETGPVHRSTPDHAIPRCGVGDWAAPKFEGQLCRWWDDEA
jgi:peptidoglycan/xylan/chitin deacetylase (PgdA/CDA1 family)